MNRIDEKFKQLKEENKKALIPYVTAGDPTIEKTEELILAIQAAGADIIEIGIPYSDPLADGPVIEAAGLRSLNNGFKLANVFNCVKNIRKKSEIPLVFMLYYNTIFGYGRERFIAQCVECDIDGLIIPDLPLEEQDEIASYLEGTNIHLIPLLAITSKDRIPAIVQKAKGFIYCVSSLGVTGVRNSFDERVYAFLNDVKKHTDVPTCVGFGIASKEDIERFDNYADGCIVGSALVKKIYETDADINEVAKFIKSLK
jgi:tryptophan synthase alpha chain